jgi:hypothetical protein
MTVISPVTDESPFFIQAASAINGPFVGAYESILHERKKGKPPFNSSE